MLTRQEFQPPWRDTPGQSRPNDQENKTDKFLSVYGMMYTIVNFCNIKRKKVNKWK